MGLPSEIIEFAVYLKNNPSIRSKICAGEHRTLVYCGSYLKPVSEELVNLRSRLKFFEELFLLNQILMQIKIQGRQWGTLYEWLLDLEENHPFEAGSNVAWRIVSGIMCKNAVGHVSFIIGDGVTPASKIFAQTEINVLRRNKNLTQDTYEMIDYCSKKIRCSGEKIRIIFLPNSSHIPFFKNYEISLNKGSDPS